MNNPVVELVGLHSKILVEWFESIVYPIWSTKGFDPASGLFHENLTRTYEPINGTRRSMVQARQIYCLTALLELGTHSSRARSTELKQKISSALARYIEVYQLESGAFSFGVDDRLVRNPGQDLYAQSFALFALARGFEISKDPVLEASALKLLNYLMTERLLANGGFSEIENGKSVCRSNPHMHLFEAAVEWLTVSKTDAWKNLNTLLYEHLEKKILNGRDMIAEEFDENWNPILNDEGAYFFEPGHHFEWAWLVARYADLSKTPVGELPAKLYASANRLGLQTGSEIVLDQVWSNGKVKAASARFWPQGERIKAAAYLARLSSTDRDGYVRDCLRSTANMLDYLQPLDAGLWTDTRTAAGEMIYANAKGSSLYHIVGAIVELRSLAKCL